MLKMDCGGFNLEFEDNDFYRDHIFSEIIDSKEFSVTQLMNIDTQSLTEESKENEPENPTGRFAQPLTVDDIQQKHVQAVPANTRKSNNWAITVWRDWAKYRNEQPQTMMDFGYPIPTNIDDFSSFEEMNFWLQRFICEIRRKNGEPYPPNTLQAITAALQRHLRQKSIQVNFFKEDDPHFSEFRRTLDSKMKELTNEGVGVEVKSADPVNKDDESQFWGKGVFSMTSARGLSNAVFFYNGKVFGFRGGQEHIGLQAEQFEVGYNHENKMRFVKFVPRIRKNAQGGLRSSKNAKSITKPIIHYDTDSSLSVSVYKLYETYLNLIPRVGVFYRKPLDGLKFSAGSISQRDLKGTMKRLFEEAGISLEHRNITNHSGRVTLCTTLFNDRFEEKTVMNRSKHSSSAVRAYEREQLPLLTSVSKALEPVAPTTEQVAPITEEPAQDYDLKHEPVPIPLIDESLSTSNIQNSKEHIELHIPSSVKKLIVVKSDGKKIILEI